MSHIRYPVSLFLFYFYFGQSGWASQLMVYYQCCLPRLVFYEPKYYIAQILFCLTFKSLVQFCCYSGFIHCVIFQPIIYPTHIFSRLAKTLCSRLVIVLVLDEYFFYWSCADKNDKNLWKYVLIHCKLLNWILLEHEKKYLWNQGLPCITLHYGWMESSSQRSASSAFWNNLLAFNITPTSRLGPIWSF